MNTYAISVGFAVLLATALTAGCEKQQSAKVPTQVAARVNADEITVHQLNYVLEKSRNVAPESAPEVKRELLEGLIAQQLAIQQAVKGGLDRSPKVLQDTEAAKREVLARAYRDHVVGRLQMPEPAEVDEYYRGNPELFAERRVFHLEELAFAADAGVADGVRKVLRNTRSMKEIADWLRKQGVRFAANQGTRTAELIALDALPKLQAMKAGDISLLEAADGRYQVIRVVAFQAAPVDKTTAAPRIRQYLFNQRARKAFAEEVKRLRDQAKIEYAGEFASSGTESAAPAKPKAETKTKGFKYSWDEEAKPSEPSGEKVQQ